jgi:hypothetical protein
VIDYLGRYVYRVAITDSRIKEVNVKQRRVVFEYKDYAAQSDPTKPPPIKQMTLEAMEFIRRFSQHVLPQGFQKIRYFGIYGTAYRSKILPLILQTLNPPMSQVIVRSVSQIVTAITGHNPNDCPCCGAQKLVVHLIVPIKTQPYNQQYTQINKHNNLIARPPPQSQQLFGEAVGLSA